MIQERLQVANKILSEFSYHPKISKEKTGYYVSWQTRNHTYKKRWSCRGQDFYPVWSRKWPGGGTSCIALSQLIRWVKEEPVLSLVTWKHWASDNVKLVSNEVCDVLKENDYPEKSICVLCHQEITQYVDWWHLDGVSGPCCAYTHGCKQVRK